MKRRSVLSNAWKGGAAFIAAAATWTTWDLLQPLATAGFGGKVRAGPPEAVPEASIVPVPAARAYLTRLDGDLIAFSEKCPHLGCRVPYCESSSRFECPCHGSAFNRAGDVLSGPSPRGLDRYVTEIQSDGLIYIDTGTLEDGPPPGTVTINEPSTGPPCDDEEL